MLERLTQTLSLLLGVFRLFFILLSQDKFAGKRTISIQLHSDSD